MNSTTSQPTDTRTAHRVTLIGGVLNTVLGIAKIVIGLLVGSAALVSDGIHSFSDVVTDSFVIVATHFGRQAPDYNHPYGHGRIETLGTLLLGSVLLFVAGGIAWASLSRLIEGAQIPPAGALAIGLAVVALLLKEWLFRFTLSTARRINSQLLEANAWHHRSDALSTVAVLVGLIGSELGLGWLDAAAAVVVGLLVGKIGGELLWDAGKELIDTALPEDDQRRMRALALAVPGVQDLHQLRTRKVADRVLLDLHLVVAPRLTVSEAHEIGNEVCRDLYDAFPELADITFHIDPEDDSHDEVPARDDALPLREDVEQALDDAWGNLDCWQRRIALDLHYIGNRIDISLYVAERATPGNLDNQAHRLREAGRELPWLGRLRVWEGPGRA